jgi:hypothetical protein
MSCPTNEREGAYLSGSGPPAAVKTLAGRRQAGFPRRTKPRTMHVQYGEGRKRKLAASASASASPARCDDARLASGRSLEWERAAGEMPDSNRLCIRELLMVASIGLPFSAWNPGTMPLCSTDISPHSRLNWKCTDTDCCAPRLSLSRHGMGIGQAPPPLTGAVRSLCGAADCGLADSSYCTSYCALGLDLGARRPRTVCVLDQVSEKRNSSPILSPQRTAS